MGEKLPGNYLPFSARDGEIEEDETAKETKMSEQWRLRALKTLKLAI